MTQKNPSVCAGGSKLVFACSGAADVGEVTDRAARKMTADGTARMFCMAGIGVEIEPILQTTRQVSQILAIDGCGINCVKACLEKAGFNNFKHLQLAELGLAKGSSPATGENVEKVCARAREVLAD